MLIKKIIKSIVLGPTRNLEGINGSFVRNRINLEYFNGHNVGDYCSKVVYEYMLSYYGLNINKKTKKTIHVSAIGSILGCFNADTTVWGSGLLSVSQFKQIINNKRKRKLDVRAVRGPITRTILLSAGYNCPDIYGDPAILLPLIYDNPMQKKYKVSYIPHISLRKTVNLNTISTDTENYRSFIDEIRRSELIISSSLHGIIIAETYGVPAIFLNEVPYQLSKFLDWYYSTDRYNIKIAQTLDQALLMTPMATPNLLKMRENLIKVFPVDLWK